DSDGEGKDAEGEYDEDEEMEDVSADDQEEQSDSDLEIIGENIVDRDSDEDVCEEYEEEEEEYEEEEGENEEEEEEDGRSARSPPAEGSMEDGGYASEDEGAYDAGDEDDPNASVDVEQPQSESGKVDQLSGPALLREESKDYWNKSIDANASFDFPPTERESTNSEASDSGPETVIITAPPSFLEERTRNFPRTNGFITQKEEEQGVSVGEVP